MTAEEMQRSNLEFIVCVYESKTDLPTERAVERGYTVALMWAAARLAHPECAYTHATVETIDGTGRTLATDTLRLLVERRNVT